MAETPLTRIHAFTSVIILVLAVVASGTGLFGSGLYRDAPVLLPQLYGQDFLTMVGAVPALALSLVAAARGSQRGYVVWLGVLGYLLYTYAFMTAFSELYLVYVALLWLTLFAFVSGVAALDANELKRTIGDTSIWPYVAFQLLLAALIAALWLSEVLPATVGGTTPPSIAEAGLSTSVIYLFDLGIVVPALMLSAYWLWQRRPWRYVFTAVLLVKLATLGGAVLAMAAFEIRAGTPIPWPQLVIFSGVTAASVLLTIQLLLSIDSGSRYSSTSPTLESDRNT
ncbi:hypothetical protein C482_10212 [Natrialba chahannaoensis JCM 10990]|uniref:Uncharacterized protein n=1 Tax=Natrialba chahannaoensis JCM 10990 TaxID=1227492 RepID=M0API4_9EURY|nr:hypothetical protein [Natrialba chahannaoensis]ELY99852.1 hypothetical protein C482_10212 [Natrialba chahannaoensis JCM 10990]